MAQEYSLADRLYREPQYEELIRVIGYEGVELGKYEPCRVSFIKKYGTRKATEAIRALVHTDVSKKPLRICLKKEIRNRVWPFLGPDPECPPWWAPTTAAPQERDVPAKPKPPAQKKPVQSEENKSRPFPTGGRSTRKK